MDPREQCSGSESPRSCISDNGFSDVGAGKRCVECQITTTPLWRGGPAGPKTLCNACGIKYHKKRRALLGLNKANVEKFKKKKTIPKIIIKNTSNNNNNSTDNNTNIALPSKLKVIRKGDININSNSNNNNNVDSDGDEDDNLGEVERAALLLMALSYGSIYY